jgi:hypothetical protein
MVDMAVRFGVGSGFEVPLEGGAPGGLMTGGGLKAEEVAEISGEYGSFVFPERVLQKLWLRREVEDGEARLQDGRRVRVGEPGRWNHLGGPDFGSAVLEIDGCRRVGDVEVHLWERDWYAHGHGADPAYDGVILHAVLFPTVEAWTKGRDERRIPILVLLPLLRRGLEDYAADEVVERLAGRPETRILDILQCCTPTERRERVLAAAVARWEEKVRWARLRLERLGWREACHHAALQALGARPNRAVMLQVASAWPLSAWQHGRDIPGLAWAGQQLRWTVQGVRPANHPQRRLQQYAEWVARVPEWPERLWEFSWPAVADIAAEVAEVRRGVDLSRLRESARLAVGGGTVRGGRFDSLVCDAWLPLLAARGREVAGLWFHWFPGELASTLGHARLKIEGGVVGSPLCQGVAQGLWAIGTNSEIVLQ